MVHTKIETLSDQPIQLPLKQNKLGAITDLLILK